MGKRLDVSKVCFGCEPLGGTDWGEVDISAIADAVDWALDCGINFFDTADVYGLGLSETRLSDILGSRRYDVVIATKGGMSWQQSTSTGGRAVIRRDSSPKYLRGAVEASLRRLRLDCLPVYFIHWPDPNIDIRLTFESLASLQNEGKIGLIGCSNFDADQLRLACEAAEVSLVQLPLNILDQEIDIGLSKVIHEKDIAVLAYNVLANGLLSGKYGLDAHFPASDRRSRLPLFQGDAYRQALELVSEITATAYTEGMTCAQYSIAKVMDRPEVTSAILGMKNRQQAIENCAFFVQKEERS